MKAMLSNLNILEWILLQVIRVKPHLLSIAHLRNMMSEAQIMALKWLNLLIEEEKEMEAQEDKPALLIEVE